MAEYKVKIVKEENDSYVELWALADCKGYVGRLTYGGGCWYHVCDPKGYCELDHIFKAEDVFIVCGPDWTELFRSSNGDGTAGFNTLRQEADEQWLRYKEECKAAEIVPENESLNLMLHWVTGEPAGGLNEWLMTFQDPDLYEKARDYPENWTMFRTEEIGKVILKTFTFLGRKFEICRIRNRHTVCGVEWDEYWSADHYIGADFDRNHIGTMYPKREARKIVRDAIRSNFPGKERIVAATHMYPNDKDGGYWYAKHVKITEAAETLIGQDFHRDHIEKVAEEERKHSSFYLDMDAAEADHPGCVKDYSFRW